MVSLNSFNTWLELTTFRKTGPWRLRRSEFRLRLETRGKIRQDILDTSVLKFHYINAEQGPKLSIMMMYQYEKKINFE